MLRLLNRLQTNLWPAPPGAIGISFSRNSVIAVRTAHEKEGYRITHMAEEPLPFFPFFNLAPSKEDGVILSQAMKRLAALVPQTYWPLQIALPDPAVIIQVMEFDTLPETVQERAAIAKFRLEKELSTTNQMECATQVLSKESEQGLLLTLFIQRSWLDCLNIACQSAGFVPSVIDATISYLFNQHYDVFTKAKGSGVLVSIESDNWSVLFWDDAYQPRLVKSRWRDSSVSKAAEYEVIVQDIERLIVSYVLSVPGRRIGKLYLCANEDDRIPLVKMLNERMQTPCVELDVTDKFSKADGLPVANYALISMAVSVPRT